MEQSNPSNTQQPVYDDNSQQQPPRFHETPGFVHPGTLRRQQPQATAHLSYDAAVNAGPSNARAGEDSSQSLDYSQGFRYDPGIGNIPRQQYIQTTSDLERVQLQQQQQQSQQYGSNAEYSIMQGQLQPQEQTYQSTFGHLQQYGPQSDLRYGTPSGPLSDSRTTQYYTGVQPDPSTAMSADYASQPREVSHFRAPTYAPGDPVSSQSTQDIMLDTRQQTPYQPYGYHQHTTIAPAPPHVKQKQAVQQQVDEKELTTYVTNIRTVFAHVRDRRLREVPELLRMTTRFLAKSFQALGMGFLFFSSPQCFVSKSIDVFVQVWLVMKHHNMTASSSSGQSSIDRG